MKTVCHCLNEETVVINDTDARLIQESKGYVSNNAQQNVTLRSWHNEKK